MEVSREIDSVNEMKRLRKKAVEFLIRSSHQCRATPIVKYTALSLFADRFLRSITTGIRLIAGFYDPWKRAICSYLRLFQFGFQIHNSRALSVKCLKSIGDEFIKDQHFTSRDFVEAEVIFLQVLNFEIGISNVAFIFLEDLFVQFKGVAKVGELVSFEACLNVMDLLYEKEETSLLFSSPCSLAASILARFRSSKIARVTSYVVTVPKQQWEFPVLPWVKFVTSYKEEDIGEKVKDILMHVFEPLN